MSKKVKLSKENAVLVKNLMEDLGELKHGLGLMTMELGKKGTLAWSKIRSMYPEMAGHSMTYSSDDDSVTFIEPKVDTVWDVLDAFSSSLKEKDQAKVDKMKRELFRMSNCE